jgi:hypothetical protein
MQPLTASEIKAQLMPSYCDIFSSYYRTHTYLPLLDLQAELPTYACPDSSVVAEAQRITSLPGIQEALSAPMPTPLEVVGRNAAFTTHGFTLLMPSRNPNDPNCYLLSEHPDLSGWWINACGHNIRMNFGRIKWERISSVKDFQFNGIPDYSQLHNCAMSRRIKEKAAELGINSIHVPDIYAVPYANTLQGDNDPSHNYFTITSKLPVPTQHLTTALGSKTTGERTNLAEDICRLTRAVGMNNERMGLAEDGNLFTYLDSPISLFRNNSGEHVWSIEQCARSRLERFKHTMIRDGFQEMADVAERHLQEMDAEWNTFFIWLSVFIPIIPLAYLIKALFDYAILSLFISLYVHENLDAINQQNSRPLHKYPL